MNFKSGSQWVNLGKSYYFVWCDLPSIALYMAVCMHVCAERYQDSFKRDIIRINSSMMSLFWAVSRNACCKNFVMWQVMSAEDADALNSIVLKHMEVVCQPCWYGYSSVID